MLCNTIEGPAPEIGTYQWQIGVHYMIIVSVKYSYVHAMGGGDELWTPPP